MIKKLILIGLLQLLLMISLAYAYDNQDSHRRITRKAVESPDMKFNSYLKSNLGIVNGYKEYINGKQVIDWLSEGSYLEDVPDCRASNHFHNPLKPWDSSQMTDQPVWLDATCIACKPFVSNVKWATGYLARSPEGAKADLQLRYNAPANWNTARVLYYQALTASKQEDREKHFTDMFSATVPPTYTQ